MNPFIAGIILVAVFYIIEYLAYYFYLSKAPKRKLWHSKNKGAFSLLFLLCLCLLNIVIEWLFKII
jgi:hypothetical protein